MYTIRMGSNDTEARTRGIWPFDDKVVCIQLWLSECHAFNHKYKRVFILLHDRLSYTKKK